MISARRIAFLGVNEPLQAHMLATLGIWPDGLVPRAEVVFSLQEAGSDAVFSLQFPGATAVAVVEQGQGGWGHLPIPEPIRRRPNEVPRAVRELEEAARAGEIAAAAVARAGALPIEPPQSLWQVMQTWVMPVSVSVPVVDAISAELLPAPADFLPGMSGKSPEVAEILPIPAAVLDEEAILAAAMMLFRRRGGLTH